MQWDNSLVYGGDCVRSTQQMGFDPATSDWKYTGLGLVPDQTCTNTSTNCLAFLCPLSPRTQPVSISMVMIDTEREKAIGVGRLWPFSAIPVGEAIISDSTAMRAGLQVGDTFYITSSSYETLLVNLVTQGIRRVYGDNYYHQDAVNQLRGVLHDLGTTAQLTVKVHATTSNSWAGKLGDGSDDYLMMEFSKFLPWLIPQLHPLLRDQISSPDLVAALSANRSSASSMSVSPLDDTTYSLAQYAALSPATAYEYAHFVLLNLAPSRINPYMSTNYDDIQDTVGELVQRCGVLRLVPRARHLHAHPHLVVRFPFLLSLPRPHPVRHPHHPLHPLHHAHLLPPHDLY